MIQTILGILKILGFLTDLFREKNKNKAEKKAELGKELIDALSKTDKSDRASSINIVINKLRK